MKIQVRLFATLAAYLPEDTAGDAVNLEVADGATVEDVARRVGIPDDLPWLAAVNGRDAAPEHALADGDDLAMFPPLAGGS